MVPYERNQEEGRRKKSSLPRDGRETCSIHHKQSEDEKETHLETGKINHGRPSCPRKRVFQLQQRMVWKI